MRAIGLGSVSLVMVRLLVTDAADAGSNAWCATYSWKGINDNCSFATQQQCLAQVWGLGGFLPTQSVSGHGVWDRLHLGSVALELRRVRRPVRRQTT